MLESILKQIVFLCRQKEKRYHFQVATSHELTTHEQEVVTNFITAQVGNHITTSFTVNTSLISGIAISGNSYEWERSIAKHLRSVEQKILLQETL